MKREHLFAFAREAVTVFVLNEVVDVQLRYAFADAGLPNVERFVVFDAFPEGVFEFAEAHVAAKLLFVVLDDIQDHIVVLIHRAELGSKPGFGSFCGANFTTGEFRR